jgi:hypothetical protein
MVEAVNGIIYIVYVQKSSFEAGILLLTRHKTKLGESSRYFVYLDAIYTLMIGSYLETYRELPYNIDINVICERVHLIVLYGVGKPTKRCGAAKFGLQIFLTYLTCQI